MNVDWNRKSSHMCRLYTTILLAILLLESLPILLVSAQSSSSNHVASISSALTSSATPTFVTVLIETTVSAHEIFPTIMPNFFTLLPTTPKIESNNPGINAGSVIQNDNNNAGYHDIYVPLGVCGGIIALFILGILGSKYYHGRKRKQWKQQLKLADNGKNRQQRLTILGSRSTLKLQLNDQPNDCNIEKVSKANHLEIMQPELTVPLSSPGSSSASTVIDLSRTPPDIENDTPIHEKADSIEVLISDIHGRHSSDSILVLDFSKDIADMRIDFNTRDVDSVYV
ncbi:hypothetical protein BKA69DRAFT_1040425 [Paraphysoderma sedebokerense]|nr:hypothetical protein BKA69DRAFT_695377 [Paraphysoderma sedebokerense]KAI9139053.1 hypothetical protein BKA69DRAFT_1040425 [Paraphysoderma sedebokerense]